MKAHHLLPLFLLACSSAPENATDQGSSSGKETSAPVSVTPIMHATMALGWKDETILVDPVGEVNAFAGRTAPTLVLITDIHPDHLDTTTLRALDLSKAVLVVPNAVKELLPADLQAKCVTMVNGERAEVNSVGLEAIAMYNMPDPDDARHPKGRGNGYVLTLGDERIYISGDTEDTPEMRALENIDIAFVCMNLPYTMSVDRAADGVVTFKPKVVYPYHYRGKDGLSDIQRFKDLVTEADPEITVRLENWYPG